MSYRYLVVRSGDFCYFIHGNADCKWRHKYEYEDKTNIDSSGGARDWIQVGNKTRMFDLHWPNVWWQRRRRQNVNFLCTARYFFLKEKTVTPNNSYYHCIMERYLWGFGNQTGFRNLTDTVPYNRICFTRRKQIKAISKTILNASVCANILRKMFCFTHFGNLQFVAYYE